jgi:O-antigen/teichoic acid export membrane protein
MTKRVTTALRRLHESAFARDVSSLWIAEGVTLFAGAAQAIVTARWLGPSGFGKAALIIGFSSLVFTLLDPRAEEAVVKYLGERVARSDVPGALAVPVVAYAADLIIGLVSFLLLAASAPWAGEHVLRDDHLIGLLILFAAASAIGGLATTSRAVLTTFRRFGTVAAVQSASAVFRTGLIVVLVANGWGVSGVIYGTAAALFVETMVLQVLTAQQIRSSLGLSWWAGRPASLGANFRGMLRFMVYTDLISFVAIFVKEADVVVLGLVRGSAEAGLYRLARSLAQPMISVVRPLQAVVYPRATHMVGLNRFETMRTAARRYTVLVGLPVAAFSLLFVPFLPIILPIVVGDEYRPAVPSAQIILIGTACVIPFFWVRPMLLALGHVRFVLWLSIVAALLTVAGYLVLGETFGHQGVAASRTLIAGLGGTGASLVFFLRRRGDGFVTELPADFVTTPA